MKDIKVEYKREKSNNYIMFFPQKEFWQRVDKNNYEYRMLEENNISSLLRMNIDSIDNEVCFRFNINSKKKLADFVSCRKLSYEDISKLIYGISNMLFSINKYLINENDIVMDMEYIYIDSYTLDVYFCSIPGIDFEFYLSLNNVLSGLLNHIDREDKRAISLIYNLYQESMNSYYTIDDLLKHLYIEDTIIDKEECIGINSSKNNKMDIEEMNTVYGYDYIENDSKQAEKKKSSFVKRLFGKNIKDENIEYEMKQSACEYIINDDVFLPDGENCGLYLNNQYNKHTVCLRQDDLLYDSYRLISKSALSSDISISHFPFVIGKQKKVCDFIINQDVVSRIHLRIDKSGEGNITVKDLNSLNGTKINGVILGDDKEAGIEPGDVLEIAGIEFVFSK